MTLSYRDQLGGMSLAQLAIGYGRAAERLRIASDAYRTSTGDARRNLTAQLAVLIADHAEYAAALAVHGVRTCDTCYHAQGDHALDCDTLRADEHDERSETG